MIITGIRIFFFFFKCLPYSNLLEYSVNPVEIIRKYYNPESEAYKFPCSAQQDGGKKGS